MQQAVASFEGKALLANWGPSMKRFKFCVFLIFFALICAMSGCAQGKSYYVSANGSDEQNGQSEKAAFKTLAKAIDAARDGSIKRITVLGELNPESEGNSPGEYAVFYVKDTGNAEIIITGKKNAKLLGGSRGKRVLGIEGNANIHLENIIITGGNLDGIGIFYGATLTLGNKAEVSNNVSNYPSIVCCESSLVMLEGSIIKNNSDSDGNGGGVYLTDSTFTMNGGIISGNTTSDNGGGVFIEDGTFTMNGGTISGNTASGGGGVCIQNGTFTMSGGAITDNSAEAAGGVGIIDDSTFTMSGGMITGNIAEEDGGGVAIDDGTFTMSGGTISKNIPAGTDVVTGGGGVFNQTGGQVGEKKTAGTPTPAARGGKVSGKYYSQSDSSIGYESLEFTSEGICRMTTKRVAMTIPMEYEIKGKMVLLKTQGSIVATFTIQDSNTLIGMDSFFAGDVFIRR